MVVKSKIIGGYLRQNCLNVKNHVDRSILVSIIITFVKNGPSARLGGEISMKNLNNFSMR